MVYVSEGNIYVRDGLNAPKQLTFSGRDRDPILSEDGEKIVFYRGEKDDNVYSINMDGSGEKLLIEIKTLPILAQGEVKALTFVPKTDFLLFNTYLCNSQHGLYDAPDCTIGIYSVDINNGKISEIVAGLNGNAMKERNFEISPDGNLIAVASSGHVDIYHLFSSRPSNLFLSDAVRYHRTTPDEFLPYQYWLPDSSGLILIISTDPYNSPGGLPGTYSALRYTINDEKVVPIPLEATIMSNSGCNFSVSPDGNWIYFLGNRSGDPKDDVSLFLGNLQTGHTQSIDWSLSVDCPSSYGQRWSSDSKYYAFVKTLVSMDGTSIPIDGQFINSNWFGSNHYTYRVQNEQGSWKTRIAEIGGSSISLPDDFVRPDDFVLRDPRSIP